MFNSQIDRLFLPKNVVNQRFLTERHGDSKKEEMCISNSRVSIRVHLVKQRIEHKKNIYLMNTRPENRHEKTVVDILK